MDHDEPVFLGPLGYSSWPGTRDALEDADLHVFIGCVRADVMTGGYSFGVSPDSTLVAGPDPDAHGHFGPLDRQILTTPEALSRALSSSAADSGSAGNPAGVSAGARAAGTSGAAWYADYRDRYVHWRTSVVGGERSDAFIDRDRAYRDAADVLPRDVILTYGAGELLRLGAAVLAAARPGIRRGTAQRGHGHGDARGRGGGAHVPGPHRRGTGR